MQRPIPSPEQAISSQTSSSSSAGTGKELCRLPAERNPPKRDREREREGERERDLVTERMMRMQWEGDVAEESARRQKQTGGQAV